MDNLPKQKVIIMVDEYTQTDDLNTTSNLKDSYPTTIKNNDSLDENVHDKAY